MSKQNICFERKAKYFIKKSSDKNFIEISYSEYLFYLKQAGHYNGDIILPSFLNFENNMKGVVRYV